MLYCPAALFTRRRGLLWGYYSVSVSEDNIKLLRLTKWRTGKFSSVAALKTLFSFVRNVFVVINFESGT